MLLPYMINRGSGLTGDIMHLCHKWQKKDGKTLTLRTRNQVYYNKNGWVRKRAVPLASRTRSLSMVFRLSGF
jgi:hypothetical protein